MKDNRDEETRTATVQAEQPADTIAPAQRMGRYLVLSEVGRGGMGRVYAAYDPKLDRRVALKVLHRGDRPTERERLLREARALARMTHPNVLTVHEVDEVDEQVLIALEFVEGGTLKHWMQKNPPKDEGRLLVALDLLVQAGKGLMAAHAEGLVHRDFKPSNVLVGADGRVRVADFGIARRTAGGTLSEEAAGTLSTDSDGGPAGSKVTQTGAVIGTPAYMAPEQWTGGEIDQRTDQFSFCVVAWEVLYSVRPVEPAPKHRHQVREIDPSQHRLEESLVPDALQRVLKKGRSLVKASRFPDLRRIVSALELETARLGGNTQPKRSRLPWKMGGATLLIAGLYFGAREANRWQVQRSCTDKAHAAIKEVWSPAIHDEMVEGAVASGFAYAPKAMEKLGPLLNARATQISDSIVSSCEGEEFREWTPAEIAASAWCVEGALIEFSARVASAKQGRPTAILSGVEHFADDPELRCDNRSYLLQFPAPTDGTRKRLQSIRATVASSREANFHHEYVESLRLARTAVERLEGIEDPAAGALMANARRMQATGETNVGKTQTALQTCERGYFDAIAAGNWIRAVDIAALAIAIAGEHFADISESEVWARRGEAALTHATPQTHARAELKLSLAEAYLGEVTLSEESASRASELLSDADAVLRTAWGKHHEQTVRIRKIFGDMASKLGKYDEARKHYQQAISESITTADKSGVLGALAKTELRAGNLEVASELLLSALSQQNDSSLGAQGFTMDVPSWHGDLAHIYMIQGHRQRAIEAAELAAELAEQNLSAAHPNTLDMYANLGNLVSRSDPERGIALLEKAVLGKEALLGPDSPLLVENLAALGGSYVEAGETEEALARLGRARTIAANNNVQLSIQAKNDLSRALLQAERHADAATVFRELLDELGPDSPAAYQVVLRVNLAICLVGLESYQEAAEVLLDAKGRVEKGLPGNEYYRYAPDHMLSNVYLQLDEFEKAKEHAMIVAEHWDGSADIPMHMQIEAKLMLATILYEAPASRGGNPRTAKTIARRALSYFKTSEGSSFAYKIDGQTDWIREQFGLLEQQQ